MSKLLKGSSSAGPSAGFVGAFALAVLIGAGVGGYYLLKPKKENFNNCKKH